MPLRISLGLGKAILDEIEVKAMDLDKSVKNENGVATDEMEKLMTERDMALDSLKEILSEILEKEELMKKIK